MSSSDTLGTARRRELKDERAPLLESIKNADLRKTAIFLGAGVDPDGLASQAVMARLVEDFGGEPHSFYRGSFNRPQNRTMQQVLGLYPKPEREFNPEHAYTCVISVDGPASVCPTLPDFIIDHHQPTQPAKIGSDVRLIGATSSIVWEYAMAAGLDFASEEGSTLATALAIGIITDTKNGAEESASDLDFEALAFCLKRKNNKLYREILNYPKPAYYNDMYAKGWANRKIEGSVLVTGLGHIPEARGGVISDLAETDGVSTAVVFGMVDGDIDISVRSSNTALNVDEFVKKAFGGGGGKRGAGRARLEMPLFKNIPQTMRDDLFRAVYAVVAHKTLQIAGDGVRQVKT